MDNKHPESAFYSFAAARRICDLDEARAVHAYDRAETRLACDCKMTSVDAALSLRSGLAAYSAAG
jgi:hypothetical protein